MKKGTNKHSISKWKHKLLIGLITTIICINGVNAESQINWFENDTDKQPFVNVDAYNWSSYPSSYESLAISPARIYTRFFTDSTGSVVDDSWGGIKTDSSINVYTQGVSFTFQPNIRFVANYLYSVTFYVCNSVSSPFNATATIQKSNTSALTGNMIYTYTNRNSVSNQLASDQVSCPYAYAYTSLVVPEVNGNYIAYRFTSSTSIRSQFLLLGYEIKELGIYNESLEASLTNIINSSGLATAKSINEVKSSISTMSSEITNAQNETNNKLDDQIEQDKEQHEEFMNSDLSEEDKQKPNQDGFDSYQESENELKDKMEQADLNNVSIGIDANSSSWVWDTLTRLIQSHSVVFGMFIAILSIGIIKLALGR